MFKSLDEINRVYKDHLDSLALSGLPFDKNGILAQWADALADFQTESH